MENTTIQLNSSKKKAINESRKTKEKIKGTS
jgi:hypothetical protein